MVPEAIQTIGFRFLLGFLNHQCLEVSSTLARPAGDHQGMLQTHRELINNRKSHRVFRDQRPSRWGGHRRDREVFGSCWSTHYEVFMERKCREIPKGLSRPRLALFT